MNWSQEDKNHETGDLAALLSSKIGCTIRLAPYSNYSKPVYECTHSVTFPMFAVKGAKEMDDRSHIIERHKLCDNCTYHLGGQCEVRDLETQTNGCADWKRANEKG